MDKQLDHEVVRIALMALRAQRANIDRTITAIEKLVEAGIVPMPQSECPSCALHRALAKQSVS